MTAFGRNIQETYDRVAGEYAAQFYDELSRKPFDRDLLDQFADLVRGHGPVCDLGCGSGQIGRYLKSRGLTSFGLDLSGELLVHARRLNPDMPFTQGDMLSLPFWGQSLAGIAAFYSIIHLHRSRISDALREFYRVLIPGGWLLLAFHGGEGEIHNDEWFGKPVSLDATFFVPDEVRAYTQDAGFSSPRIQTRDPYPFEYPSQRVYLLAHKKAGRHSLPGRMT